MSNKSICFCDFIKKKDDNNAIVERIHFLNSNLTKLKKVLAARISYKNNSCTIDELITKYNSYFSVEWQECFLYKSYILTLFKKSNSQELYISSDEMAHFFSIPKKSSKKMIHKYQSHLSMLSCEFIKTIALDLDINEKNSPNIVSSILRDDNERMVYPCFFYSKVLFMHMQKTGCAVLIILETVDADHSRKDLILFDGGNNQGRLLTRNNNFKEEACMVVVCKRIASMSLSAQELLKKLNGYGLYHILLMNMAAHPQFSGLKLALFAEQLVPPIADLVAAERQMEEEFWALKKSAHKNGCCRDNPALLLVKHISIDSLSNQIDLQENTNEIMNLREGIDT